MRCFVAGVIYGWQYVFLEKNARNLLAAPTIHPNTSLPITE